MDGFQNGGLVCFCAQLDPAQRCIQRDQAALASRAIVLNPVRGLILRVIYPKGRARPFSVRHRQRQETDSTDRWIDRRRPAQISQEIRYLLSSRHGRLGFRWSLCLAGPLPGPLPGWYVRILKHTIAYHGIAWKRGIAMARRRTRGMLLRAREWMDGWMDLGRGGGLSFPKAKRATRPRAEESRAEQKKMLAQ